MEERKTGLKALQEGLYQLSELNKFRSYLTESRNNGTYGTFTVLSFENQHNEDKEQQSNIWPECSD